MHPPLRIAPHKIFFGVVDPKGNRQGGSLRLPSFALCPRRAVASLIATALFLALGSWLTDSCWAASASWNVAGGGDWTTPANWTAGGPPNGLGQIATFGNAITADSIVTLNLPQAAAELIFDDDNSYNVGNSANLLTLNENLLGNGITVNNTNGNGAHTISSPIALAQNIAINQNSTGKFVISGAISETGALRAIFKTGAGTAQFSGTTANTYSGPTTVNEGTVELNKAAGVDAIPRRLIIGDGTGIDTVRLLAADQISNLSLSTTVNSSGVLDLNGNADRIETLIVNNGGQVISSTPVTLTLASAGLKLQLNNGADLSDADVAIDLAIASAFVTIAGSSPGNPSTIAGNIVVSDTVAFDVNDVDSNPLASDLIVTGVISGAPVKTFQKRLGGAMEIGGTTANSFPGNVVITAGELRLNKPAGVNAIAGTVAIGDSSGSDSVILLAPNQIADTADVIVNAGGGVFNLNNNNESIDDLLNDGSVMLGNATLTVGSGNNNDDGDFLGVVSGPGAFTKVGTGIQILSGTVANTYGGTTTINGGTLTLNKSAGVNAIPGNVAIGDGSGTDTLRLNAANQIANTSDVTINAGGVFNLNSRAEAIDALAGVGAVTLGSATLTVGSDGGTAAFTGAISGTGGFTKTGAGTQTLGGTSSYSGLTTVSAGTLLVNGTHTNANAVAGNGYSVAGGATLGGTGAISLGGTNSVAVNGTLGAGASPGTLDINAILNFNNNSTFAVELGGNTPGDGTGFYDQVNMTLAAGAVNLTGTVNLNVSLLSFTPTPTDVFYVLTRADAGTFSTFFANLAEGAQVDLGGGNFGFITYHANWTGTQAGSSMTGGNDVAITMTPVPEPTSGILLAILGAVLINVRGRARTW